MYCTKWAWSFLANLVDLCGSIPFLMIQGMGSVDSPIQTQKDCMEGDLGTLKLFCIVHCVVAVRLPAGHQVGVFTPRGDSHQMT